MPSATSPQQTIKDCNSISDIGNVLPSSEKHIPIVANEMDASIRSSDLESTEGSAPELIGNGQNRSAVDTMLTAAKVAAVQYRESHTIDALTVITSEGVRVAPVLDAMHMIAQSESNMSDNDRDKWNANTDRLRAHVLSDVNNLWFATKRDGNIDIWQSSLVECKELMNHLTTSQTQ